MYNKKSKKQGGGYTFSTGNKEEVKKKEKKH